MKMTKVITFGACMICALVNGNALATTSENYSMILAANSAKANESSENLSDYQLAAKVREKFVEQKLFGKDKFADMGIHVTSENGVVTITGRVSSKDDEDEAVRLAKSVDQVKSVESKII